MSVKMEITGRAGPPIESVVSYLGVAHAISACAEPEASLNGDNGDEHDNEDDVICNCDCILSCDFHSRGHRGKRDDEDFGSVGSDPYQQYPRP